MEQLPPHPLPGPAPPPDPDQNPGRCGPEPPTPGQREEQRRRIIRAALSDAVRHLAEAGATDPPDRTGPTQ
ncbi:hypothetical protein GCM10025784_15950 [Citricoccus nitrophenolicus]